MTDWFSRVRRDYGKSTLTPASLLHARTAPVSRLDRTVTRAIAARPPSPADIGLRRLTNIADHSALWFTIASGLALRRGAPRKAALRGVLSIGLASFTANVVLKPLLPRRRPAAGELPAYRRIADPPTSSSFPSGHAASAAAFATAVALENPRAAPMVVLLATAVAYSRVHVGVHWASDVIAGAAVGSAQALATRRWWPVRRTDEARARPLDMVPELPRGKGLLIVANPFSGPPDVDIFDEVAGAWPEADALRVQPGLDIDEQLETALAERGAGVSAIGVAGGDGTIAAAAAVANRHGLPLVVVPAGTLNHFARDVGVYDLREAIDATATGEAVAVSLALVEAHAGHGTDPTVPEVLNTRYFVNTASIGSYPELVRLRERWQPRWGKWPAFAAALVTVLRRSKRVRVKIGEMWTQVWFVFVGNGPYHPVGMVPAWRPTLDSGLLDVRWLRADVPFSRLRVAFALLLGALGHSKVYQRIEVSELDVELVEPSLLATDGEVVAEAGRYTFRVAAAPIPVYRRDEEHWIGQDRPFLG